MREIVLDTETTGLSVADGHRVVEIGCVEVVNYIVTGETFQRYLNPERSMPEGAFAVHGLSDSFLADKPTFDRIAEEFLDFIGDAPLVIHNADFDLGFLNAELTRTGHAPLPAARAIDTVRIAREMFFGAPASLDALCKRFDIDIADRAVHGALKDARLLAEVYLQLRGGRQPGLALVSKRPATIGAPAKDYRQRVVAPTAEEEAAHARFLDKLKDPLWRSGLADAAQAAADG
jgi:DNA polymerase-3 subunit epsilon